MNEAAEQGGAKFDIEEIVDQLLERILDQRPLPLESDCLIDVCIQGSEVFMQVPCNEAIKSMIRQKVLSEGKSEPLRKKVESKYVVQRTYKAMTKRPDAIVKEEVSPILEHDARYSKLFNSDTAPK